MNEALFRFVNQSLKNPLFDTVLPLFSDKDYVVIPGVAALAVLAHLGGRRTRTCILALGLALLAANAGSEKVLKNVFQERRPYASIENVNLHRGGQWRQYDPRWYDYDSRKSFAFPSSHAANAAALVFVLAFFNRRTLWATIPLGLLVGVSRVYTGQHYPGDVLGGYAWGALCGAAMTALSFWAVRRIWGETGVETRAPMTRERKAFWGVLGLWTALNFSFVYWSSFDLAGDEAQYWDWSRRLALGYYSKPPLIAYLIAALTGAGGHKEWAIRSGAVLLSSATLAVVYALTLRIAKREQTALLAVCALLAMPASWAGSVLLTIDPATLFFWAVAMYAFHRAVNGEGGYWVLTGLALGLGMLAKYTAGVLVGTFALYLLVVDRRHLRSAGPYVALGLMGACLTGVGYWNATHDWVSIRHTAHIGAGQANTIGRALAHFGEFVGGQVGLASPILFVLYLWAVIVLVRRFRRNRDAAFLVLSFGVLFGVYALVSLFRKPLPNWPAAAYLAAAPAFAWVWSERPRCPWARGTLAVGIALGCILGIAVRSTDLVYMAASPSATDRPDRIHLAGLSIDPDKDPTNHLRGGRELGAALTKRLDAYDSPKPFIFSNRYQLTAWPAFYTKGRPQTYCIDPDNKRRFNQYDLWGGWDDLVGRDALFVTGGRDLKAAYFIHQMVQAGAFESGECIETVEVWRGKTLVRTFTISEMHGYTGALRSPTQDKY